MNDQREHWSPPRTKAKRGPPCNGAALAGASWLAHERVEVSGASMLPALRPGDRLVVLRLPRRWPLRPGQLVALRDPRTPGGAPSSSSGSPRSRQVPSSCAATTTRRARTAAPSVPCPVRWCEVWCSTGTGQVRPADSEMVGSGHYNCRMAQIPPIAGTTWGPSSGSNGDRHGCHSGGSQSWPASPTRT